MRSVKQALLAAIILASTAAWGAPYIGYCYPAGGRQGKTFRVHLGGQRLMNVKTVLVSGAGMRGTFVSFEGAEGPLNYVQRDYLRQLIENLKKNPPAAMPATPPATPAMPEQPKVTLPDLPDLRDLEKKSPEELNKLLVKYVYTQKTTKPPLAEDVILEVTIAPDAVPGTRELRVITPGGLSNPVVFQVGSLPEVLEKDPSVEKAVDPPPTAAPAVFNGQIMPGGVDRFALNLKGGQRLYLDAQARRLIPFIADAVPGWFQIVVAVRDADGNELAYACDNRSDPDPAMIVQVPKDGAYTLIVRDSIYRGRQDFVYRVTLREQAAGDTLFPFTAPARQSADDAPVANPQLPVVDRRIPLVKETEPNDAATSAQPLALPQLIQGRIDKPGDVDLYQFTGKAGDAVVAEVYARRLGSEVDALVRLLDAAGKVIAWNDDYTSGEMGMVTHRADAYLTATLPADGVYTVRVSDAQGHGGDAFAYYLRVSPPQPDVVLRITPSGINVPANGTTTVTAYAFRQDGWDGNIEIALVDAPDGFTLSNTRIPRGKDSVTMTLKGPKDPTTEPLTLTFVALIRLGDRPVIRPLLPADRQMQAFAYYHLVPAQQLLVMVYPR